METFVKILGAITLVVIILCLVAVLMALPVMWLWNWLMPVIFPTEVVCHHINFWQALGITLLCSFLFKSSSSTVKKD